jgi:restriction endonuclease S subunit
MNNSGAGMSGWEEKTLADVASSFGRGKSRHRPRNDESLYGGKFPFIQTGEIREANHFITEYSKTYNEKGLAQSKLWPVGTLCITIAANIAETAILTFDACIPDSVIGLVCDTQKANVDFVEYLLQHFKSVLQAEGKGSAQDNINMGTFEKMAFPFPSVSEQERIVSILDEAFGAIAKAKENAERNLANAKELFESYLNKVFTEKGEGWEETTVGDVCELYQGLAINKKTKHLLVPSSDLPLLRIKDLRNGTAEQFVAESGFPEQARIGVDDLIYTRTGNSLGLVFRGRTGVLHNNSFKIVPGKRLDRGYFYWWLLNPTFTSTVFRIAKKAAQPDITHKLFKAQPICVPPLDVQARIAANIQLAKPMLDRVECVYQQKASAFDELKQSILQKAFTGQLTSKSSELEAVG